MRALILNDTRNGNHLGCIIVMQQLASLCKEVGIDVVAMLRLGRHFEADVVRHLPDCDVVIINGEGTMHHDAPGAMALVRAGALAARHGVPIALVNTVWQDNQQANALLAHCRWISTRESLSQQAVVQAGHQAVVVPDLTLTTPADRLFGPATGSPGQGVVVMDDVRPDVSLALAHHARSRGQPFLPMGGRPSLRTPQGWSKLVRLGMASGWAPQFDLRRVGTLRDAALVVTGRFHGICLAILAGRPFVSFASNTHKIEGLLRDADLGPGGRLFDDPPDDPARRDAYIDDAVAQVLAHMAQDRHRADHVAACERYVRRARLAAQQLFSAVGAGHRVA